MQRELTPRMNIERSINKKYRREIWNPFVAAVKNYALLAENDRIAVPLTNAAAPVLLAVLLRQLQRYSEFPFSLVFYCAEKDADALRGTAGLLEFDFTPTAKTLPAFAEETGCNRIAEARHMSNAAEITLAGLLYDAKLECFLPGEPLPGTEKTQIIRPLYGVRRDAILAWVRYNALTFPQTDALPAGEHEQKAAQLIAELKEKNPLIENNIFNSIHAVHADTFVGCQRAASEASGG